MFETKSLVFVRVWHDVLFIRLFPIRLYYVQVKVHLGIWLMLDGMLCECKICGVVCFDYCLFSKNT